LPAAGPIADGEAAVAEGGALAGDMGTDGVRGAVDAGCAGGGGDFPIQVSAAADARSPSAVGLRAAAEGGTGAGEAWAAGSSAAEPAVGG